jgi:hypothetical protein
MPETAVREIIDLCHKHDVFVSTGGFIERVLVQGDDASNNTSLNAKSSGSILSRSQLASSQFRRMIGSG